MCQYTPACKTIRHRPGTICPLAGRAPRTFASPVPPRIHSAPRGGTPASKPARGSQPSYRIPAAGAGVSGLDLLAWLLVLNFADAELTLGWMVAFAVAVFLPLIIASALTDKCGAWIIDQTRRCTRARRGPLRRCQDHKNQIVTAYDLAGLLALVVAVINGTAFFIDAL